MALQDTPKAARGTRAALIGAVVGLVPAVGLGALRVLNGEAPAVAAQVAGNIAFTLVYASPYLLALIASRAGDPGVRGSLLAALGLLSLVASFSTFSLVTVVLLPATFILWFASVRSLAASGRPLATSLPAAVVGLLIAATVGLGFFALWGIQDDEARCWILSYDSDEPHWEPRPNLGESGVLTPGTLDFDSRGHCTSDIITSTEAAMGIGAAVAALLTMLLVSRLRWPPSGHTVRTAPPLCAPTPPG